MLRSDRTRGIVDNLDLERVLGVGIRLRAVEFDRAIVRYGNWGEYRRHLRCPCVRDGSRTAVIDCADCHGTGRIWPEDLRQRMIAVDWGRQATMQMVMAGTWREGSCQLLFPSVITPSFGDQWWPDNEEMTIEESFQRDGTLQVQREEVAPWMGYGTVPPAQVVGKARLTYERPCCFEAVAYKDADTGDLRYAEPYQYNIDNDRVWTWRAGGPKPGEFWTVRYRAPAVYQIHTAEPAFRSQAEEQLPYRCSALRLDKVSGAPDGDIRT